MKAYFLSDVHLKSPDEPNSLVLLSVLRQMIESAPTHLFLLGDIFDLWVGAHGYFADKFSEHIKLIKRVVAGGTRVIYFEGNHDFHLSTFWCDELGCEVCEGPKQFELGSCLVHAEHGDLINTNDLAYQRYYRFSRHSYTKWALLNMPSSAIRLLGETFSKVSRRYSGPMREEKQNDLRQMIRGHAKKIAEQTPFDLVVTGHMHVFDDYLFQVKSQIKSQNNAQYKTQNTAQSCRSVNLGSWLEQPVLLQLDYNKSSFSIDIIYPK